MPLPGASFTEEQRAVIALHLIPEIGPQRFRRLVEHFGSAVAVLTASAQDLDGVSELSAKTVRHIAQARDGAAADREIALAGARGVRILVCTDDDFPATLKVYADCPPVLYCAGELRPADLLSVAVVGTRRPTPYGRSVAAKFGRDCASRGLVTVSGLARGIDTEVHRATIAEGGRTIAVLGNGFEHHYPPENRKLEEQVRAQGALLSEFPLATGPDRQNFPRRNRIISALSLATIVVEADVRSGALITARYAADQGKDVFAVPGPIFSVYSQGPHQLLRDGAFPALSIDDVAYALQPLVPLVRKRPPLPPQGEILLTDPLQERLLALIGAELSGVSVDQLAAALRVTGGELAAPLLELELKGLVRNIPGNRFVRCS